MIDQQEAQHAQVPNLPLKEQQIEPGIVQAFQQGLVEREEVEEVNTIFKNLQKAFYTPETRNKEQQDNQRPPHGAKGAQNTFKSISVEYVPNPTNSSIITNPQAIFDILDPDVLLRSDGSQRDSLSDGALNLIFDELLRIVLSCQPNNSLHLLDYHSQPMQNLKLHFSFFTNSNFDSGDVVRQFIVQNNMNLAQAECAERSRKLNRNSEKLVLKYG